VERLREFRRLLYECLGARADALFELSAGGSARHDPGWCPSGGQRSAKFAAAESVKPLQDTLIKDALGLTEFADEVMSLLPSAFAAGPGGLDGLGRVAGQEPELLLALAARIGVVQDEEQVTDRELAAVEPELADD
jgi:hypothetical protein